MENDNFKKEEFVQKKISYDDFAKVEIKAGKILNVEKVPDTDRLIKLSVDFGSFKTEIKKEDGTIEVIETKDVRQIISGIALYFPDLQVLIGQTFMFVSNLEPRVIKGLTSDGMILGLGGNGKPFALLKPSQDIEPGTAAN